jgi:hypothetical protein
MAADQNHCFGSSVLELGYEGSRAEQTEVSFKLPSTHLPRAIGYRIKENAEFRGNPAQLRVGLLDLELRL